MYFRIFINIVKVLFTSSCILFSSAGLYLLSQKPDLPFRYTNSEEKIIVRENYSSSIKEN
jgi:hypothetical protein